MAKGTRMIDKIERLMAGRFGAAVLIIILILSGVVL